MQIFLLYFPLGLYVVMLPSVLDSCLSMFCCYKSEQTVVADSALQVTSAVLSCLSS